MSKGIRFTDEFKQDAVAQVVERGYRGSSARVFHSGNVPRADGAFQRL
jgi:transposase-like protein